MAYILKVQNSNQWACGESGVGIQNVKGTHVCARHCNIIFNTSNIIVLEL
jgi:hypothetical protein